MAGNTIIHKCNCARILRFVKDDEIENNELKLAPKDRIEHGCKISSKVIFQLPNGQQYHVRYNKRSQTFTNVGQMFREIKMSSRLILVLCCNGDDSFLINVFNNGFTEYDYLSVRKIPRAPVYTKDSINGVGWSFLSLSIGSIQSDGGAMIPHRFVKWFGNNIPMIINIGLENGEVIDGLFSKADFKIYGLLPLIRKQYFKLFDIFMFTYCGDNRFEVCVFDISKVERKFAQNVIVDEDGTEGENTDDDMEDVQSIQEMDNGVVGFVVAMKCSNVNNSSHGVYIPRHITPGNGNWIGGQEVVLRTQQGDWTCVLVMSNGMARISAGWNKFVKDNEIDLQNSLRFYLFGKVEGMWTFDVEIE